MTQVGLSSPVSPAGSHVELPVAEASYIVEIPVGKASRIVEIPAGISSRKRSESLSCTETCSRVDNYLKVSGVFLVVDTAMLTAKVIGGVNINNTVLLGGLAIAAVTGLWGAWRQSSNGQNKS